MPKYNHALTIAYEVITEDPDGGTFEERMAGLRKRIERIEADPVEARGAVMNEAPYDTFEMEDV